MSNLSAITDRNTVAIQPRIEAALTRASRATGVDFKYLVDTALRESNLKTGAKSKASSATGLFQFIDETWLSTLKEFGPKFGLQRYSDAIEKTASGRHIVSSPALNREILALRTNPEISAMMAGAYAGKSAAYLKELLGREPRQGEVYITHFLGLKGGGELVAAASQRPDISAAGMFPQAARSNPSIFYNKSGQPRTVRQVYFALVSRHSNDIASYSVQQPQVVRIPGQPLKLNTGLLTKTGRPRPVENALFANAQYVRSNVRTRAIPIRPAPVQSQPADLYQPTPWPVKPVQSHEQKVLYPSAGPGSLGYASAAAAIDPRAPNNNGSLVRADRRPFSVFARIASVFKPRAEEKQTVISSKPTVLEARYETNNQDERLADKNTPVARQPKFGQLFVNTGASFFAMPTKK